MSMAHTSNISTIRIGGNGHHIMAGQGTHALIVLIRKKEMVNISKQSGQEEPTL